MPWSDVKPLIESELGKPIGAVYLSVEETPLAAASIAQVHAAKLLSGEDVVIKVQKKGVQGSLKADLDLLYANARVLQLIGVVTSELSDVSSLRHPSLLRPCTHADSSDHLDPCRTCRPYVHMHSC